VVQGDSGRVSWELALTADFLPTIMDVLNVSRPAHQADWGVDGRSMLPLLNAPTSAFDRQDKDVYADSKNVMPPQPMGWMYNGWQDPQANGSDSHAAFRFGQWKYVHRSKSCSSPDCLAPMLFDLSKDISESTDVSKANPDIFAAIQRNFTTWYKSVLNSIVNESKCTHIGPTGPVPPPPPPVPPSSDCIFKKGQALGGGAEIGSYPATAKESCCAMCGETKQCAGAAFHPHGGEAKLPAANTGTCVLRKGPLQMKPNPTGFVCIVNPKVRVVDDVRQQHDADWVIDETDFQ